MAASVDPGGFAVNLAYVVVGAAMTMIGQAISDRRARAAAKREARDHAIDDALNKLLDRVEKLDTKMSRIEGATGVR